MSRKYSFGLCLSGGGIKGLVHAGFIHFLDELDLKPDVIASTSTGSIVASLYASGHNGESIKQFYSEEKPFARKYWLGSKGLMNTTKYRDIFDKYLKAQQIEELDIKLKILSTDLFNGKSMIFESGDLINAVLASSAYPGVFQPMEINGILYSDGGILNHFPADTIREETDFLVGIHLSPTKVLTKDDLKNTRDVVMRAAALMGTFYEEQKLKLCDVPILVRENTNYSTFQIKPEQYDELFEIGYQYGKKYEAQLRDLKSKQKKATS